MNTPLLKILNLSLTRGGRPLFQDLSFELAAGELLGLIGPNGAGKTSLLETLLGLRSFTQGHIEIQGAALSSWARPQLAKVLAYLPQNPEIHWPLKVEHFVELGLLPYAALEQMTKRSAIEEIMLRTATLELASKRIDQLSGGERARVLLARALAQQTPVLFADEPIANLDPFYQLAVMTILKDYCQAGNSAVAVLHDLNFAARFCDRILLLAPDQIPLLGSPDEVLTAEHMAQAFRVTLIQDPAVLAGLRIPGHAL